MQVPTDPTKNLLRFAILGVAAVVFSSGLYSLYVAATQWTSLPTNPIVVLYFLIVLVTAPLLALWAFVLAWQDRRPALAAVLAAIPAAILILRTLLVGGL